MRGLRSPAGLIAACSALALAAAGAAADLSRDPGESSGGLAFQRLTGGIGFTQAPHPGECPGAFDPRMGESCAQWYGPLPGGEVLCPDPGAHGDRAR